MSDQYRLVGLRNSELLAGLSELVRQSSVLTARVLAHLVELEERMLHLELGFSSLFAYCVEALGMSEGTAGRRVTAVRVCRRFPEVFEHVARGELHLCALCALAPHLKPENAAELFEACLGKTRRQVEELLAARFPRPDIREQIRRLPVPTLDARGGLDRRELAGPAQVPVEVATPVGTAEQTLRSTRTADERVSPATALELRAESSNRRVSPATALELRAESPNPLPSPAPVPAPVSDARRVADARRRARELEPLSAGRFGVHFTADAELRELIERARALASHRLPNGDLAGLMKLMVASFVRQEEKRRFGVGARPRQAKATPKPARCAEWGTPPGGVPVPPGATEPTVPTVQEAGALVIRKRGRYLAAAVRRETHGRDHGRCAFVSADARRCAARAFLEFDHIQPYARLGAPDAGNLRLLCKAHNLLHARSCFGTMHIAAKIAARKRRDPAANARKNAPLSSGTGHSSQSFRVSEATQR